ncbi:unnamed protein product, partial [Rotaria magnacalcarata]
MQPNSNRPVYIVQPSNITHFNVRPTTITTGGQQVQTQQQSSYQISTVRQPMMSPQPSTLYQVQPQPQPQPRLLGPSPVYASLQSQRFTSTSPRQIITTNTNLSPSLLTPQSLSRLPLTAAQPTTTILRPNIMSISTSPTVASISTPMPSVAATAAAQTAAAAASKDFSVRVPKTRAQYGIMEFASGVSVDV